MFFVDHIAENEKKQDRIFVAPIIEALCYMIKKEFPGAEQVAFVTDNARCYNNNLIPVILPAICEKFRLVVHLFLHPDACCGKSVVDAHFAI